MRRILAPVLTLLAACGGHTTDDRNPSWNKQATGDVGGTESEKRVADLEKKMAQLLGTQEQLQTMVMSDFSSCDTAGEAADPLINKICKVAQAANIETRVLLKSELSTASQALGAQVNSLSDNLARVQDGMSSQSQQIDQAIADLTTKYNAVAASLASLQARMTNAETAITALQAMTASITGVLMGSLQEIEIGKENISAGPIFESLLRRADKSKIIAYAEALAPALSLPNAPLKPTGGSDLVLVSATNHGLSVGDIVRLSDLTEGAGFTSGDLVGEFSVVAVPSSSQFSIRLRRPAANSNSFGGTLGIAQKIQGRGLATVWSAGQGADSTVRWTTLGSRRYSFLIRANGEVCYSKANSAATYAEITAGGSMVLCK